MLLGGRDRSGSLAAEVAPAEPDPGEGPRPRSSAEVRGAKRWGTAGDGSIPAAFAPGGKFAWWEI